MLNRIRITLSLLLLLGLQARAQTPKIHYAMVPMQLKGDVLPVSQADFMQRLQDEVNKQSPDVTITLVDLPQTKNWDMLAPEPSEVQAICKRLGVDRLAWGSVRFKTDSRGMRQGGNSGVGDLYPGQSGAGTFQYIVTMAGAADLHVVDGQTGKVLLDEPFAIFRSESTNAAEGTDRFDELQKELALHCSADLAAEIITQGKKRMNP